MHFSYNGQSLYSACYFTDCYSNFAIAEHFEIYLLPGIDFTMFVQSWGHPVYTMDIKGIYKTPHLIPVHGEVIQTTDQQSVLLSLLGVDRGKEMKLLVVVSIPAASVRVLFHQFNLFASGEADLW